MDHDEKLTVLLPLKVSEAMARDLKKFAGGSRKRPDWVRQAIAEKLERCRQEITPKVTRAEARALAELRKLGIDPEAALETILAAR